jgi:hypothetical protein
MRPQLVCENLASSRASLNIVVGSPRLPKRNLAFDYPLQKQLTIPARHTSVRDPMGPDRRCARYNRSIAEQPPSGTLAAGNP